MNLSKRLNEIINMIPEKGRIFDIGCDHGLLTVTMALQSRTVIASDIHEKPLEKAKKLAKDHDVYEKINFYLEDGIPKMPTKKEDVFVLAGMGGYTIVDIMKDQKDGIFIIQANTDLEFLRRSLFQKGFVLTNEKAIFDKKWYVIMKWERGHQTYQDIDFIFGPFCKNQKDYMLYVKQKYEKILKKSKREDIKQKLLLIQKVL